MAARPSGDKGGDLPAEVPDFSGRRIDRYGPPTSLTITDLAGGASQGPELTRRIRVGTEQRLRASAYAASCDEAAEHPACHLARRDWDLRVVPGGPTRVELVLDGHG